MTQRGTLLGGRYELDQIIGRGGMAEVWRGRDTRLERDVAIKRLRIDLASDPTFQARFRREAQSAAGLNHPNIVAVYDTGEELDPSTQVSVPYIVMELVEGVTLRDVLRDGRKILPERALEFTAGVLDGLEYSHRAGIIHRDIKPANVMLTPAGAVKVMDFGIARAVADTSATMTQTAAVIGTAQYLSPEQARGEKVDHRSDIYSVGCLLYELLVSEPPFKGDSPVSVAYQHVREAPVPPSQLDAEVTPGMDAVTLKALAKSADDRYQDAREMRDDVLRAMKHEPVLAMLAIPGSENTTALLAADPTTEGDDTADAAALAEVPSDEQVEEDEEESKSRKPLVILLILAALLLAGIVAAVAMVLNSPQNTVAPSPSPSPVVSTTMETSPSPTVTTPEVVMIPVPRVLGETQVAAENTLSNAGFLVKVEEVVGTEKDKGTVLVQDPKANEEVPEGTEVTIRVSTGSELKIVPDVLGKTEAEARQMLSDAGFNSVSAADALPEEEDPSATPGTVVGSAPAVGTEENPATTITLTIATGKSIVPDLVGRSEDEAKDLAKKAGFNQVFDEVEVESDEAPGTVIAQFPKAGRPMDRTDSIQVQIAVPRPVEEEPEVSPSEETPEPTATAEEEG